MTDSAAAAARGEAGVGGAKPTDIGETEMLAMNDIVALARNYAKARDALEETGEEIRQLQRKAVRDRLRGLRSRVAETAAAHDALFTAIKGRPDLFVKPRTVAVDGVKFGFRKQAGALDVGDEAKAIEMLRKKLPGLADTLIVTRESLEKKQLRKLPAADLARIGVTIGNPVDDVVIAVAESDVDKLVAALLDDGEEGVS